VTGNEGDDSEKRIIAWVVPQDSESQSSSPVFSRSIKAALKEELPPYMIPQAIVTMESLPVTPNGKIDIKALPLPDIEQLSEADYQAPVSEWECRLATLWSQALKLSDDISVNSNFFELGGHSLLATRLCNSITERFGIELPVSAIFEQSTLAQLARYIETMKRTIMIKMPPVIL